MIRLATEHTSSDLCIKLAEGATQLAIFAENTTENKENNGNKENNDKKRNSGSGSRSAASSVVDAIKSLSSQKTLSLSNKRLPYDLSVLSALVHVPISTSSTVDFKYLYFSSSIYDAVRTHRNRILSFVQNEVLKEGLDDSAEHSGEHSSVAEIVCAGIKLWTALVVIEAECSADKKEKNRNSIQKKKSTQQKNKRSGDEEENEVVEEVEEVLFLLIKTEFLFC